MPSAVAKLQQRGRAPAYTHFQSCGARGEGGGDVRARRAAAGPLRWTARSQNRPGPLQCPAASAPLHHAPRSGALGGLWVAGLLG
jgi:hypothetical protein